VTEEQFRKLVEAVMFAALMNLQLSTSNFKIRTNFGSQSVDPISNSPLDVSLLARELATYIFDE